jgi:hypothetical protein
VLSGGRDRHSPCDRYRRPRRRRRAQDKALAEQRHLESVERESIGRLRHGIGVCPTSSRSARVASMSVGSVSDRRRSRPAGRRGVGWSDAPPGSGAVHPGDPREDVIGLQHRGARSQNGVGSPGVIEGPEDFLLESESLGRALLHGRRARRARVGGPGTRRVARPTGCPRSRSAAPSRSARRRTERRPGYRRPRSRRTRSPKPARCPRAGSPAG